MKSFEFEPGRNCWRAERAARFSIIVDGADYFRALREALLKAERLVTFVGWDFDFELEMLPGESDADGNAPDGFPNQVGPFLDALAERREGLDIYLLKWSGGALIAPGRLLPAMRIKFLSPAQIHLAFDGRHPIGACHHQKIVTMDDSLAFCGGIDLTKGRWDTRGHTPGDIRRGAEGDGVAQAWHDVTTVMDGPAAAALSRLSRLRWDHANDAAMDEDFAPGGDLWPESVPVGFRDPEIAIARTEPPEVDRPIVNEIEQLYLDSINQARDYIYLESQYFASDSIFRAIMARLRQKDGPEIVVINPRAAQTHLEDQAMHVTRSRMIRALEAMDSFDRFRIYYPVDAAGEDIYVHAKVSIADDRLLRVGSSNIDRRSMGFDTECDVALLAQSRGERRAVRALRNDLLAEHLDCAPEDVARIAKREGSLFAAIDALNPVEGRRLCRLYPRKQESLLGRLLADSRFFDPRYRQSAQARLGVTSRHVMIGAATLAAGTWLALRRWRR